MSNVTIPARNKNEFYVGSSIQFRLETLDTKTISNFIKSCFNRGVELKWFGDSEPKAFTSRYDSWSYIENLPVLPNTLSILEKTFDMRIPLTFTLEDCEIIADVLQSEITKFSNLNHRLISD
jgi:hypothetical protein